MHFLALLTVALPLVAAMPVHDRHHLHLRQSRSLASFGKRACKLRGPAFMHSPFTSCDSTTAPSSSPQNAAPSTSVAAAVVAAAVVTSSSAETYVTPAAAIVAPTSSYVAPAPATSTVAATPASSGSGESAVHSGQLTYYAMGLGSCGITSTDSDYSLAVSHLLFDGFEGYTGGNPNNNPICGRKIKAMLGGNSVTMTVVDRCEGCAIYDLDFSSTAFLALVAGVTQNSNTGLGIGRADGLTWQFI